MEISGKSFHINLRLNDMRSQIWTKFIGIAYRILDYIKNTPIRLKRLFKHLWKGGQFLFSTRLLKAKPGHNLSLGLSILMWWTELSIYLLDCLGGSELYETLMDFVKFNTRPLYQWEITLAQSVFGSTINYRRVRIDEYSIVGPKQKKFCYVSFYIVNSWGQMQNSTLIHELTHVWQFEKMGSVYIPHALMAQRSQMGYDYGGISALKKSQKEGKSFLSFNLEQQGDIISDYYRIRDGYEPHWGNGCRHDLPVYESFINQVRNR